MSSRPTTHRTVGGPSTPPPLFIQDEATLATPGPIRARLRVMEKQNEVLHKERGAMDRKYKAELANVMELVSRERAARIKVEEQLEGRTASDMMGLRQELETTKRQSALDLAQEKLHAVKLEKQIQTLKQQKLKHEHETTTLRAESADLAQEVKRRTAEMKDVEIERSRLSKQLSSLSSELEVLKQSSETDRRNALKTHKSLQTRITELETELEEATVAQKGRGGEAEKEIRGLKAELRAVKSSLESKTDEAKELEEELERTTKQARENEKALKAKLKSGGGGGSADVDVKALEEELEALKEANEILKNKARQYRDEARALRASAGAAGSSTSKAAEVAASDEGTKAAAAVTTKKSAATTSAATDITGGNKRSRKPATYAEDSDDDEYVRPSDAAVKRKPLVDTTSKGNVTPAEDEDDAAVQSKTAELKAKNSIFAAAGKNAATAGLNDVIKKKHRPVDEQTYEDSAEAAASAAAASKPTTKKRKLGNLLKGATFTWDPSKNPEGPIPSYLSPVKGGGAAPPRSLAGTALSKGLFGRM